MSKLWSLFITLGTIYILYVLRNQDLKFETEPIFGHQRNLKSSLVTVLLIILYPSPDFSGNHGCTIDSYEPIS